MKGKVGQHLTVKKMVYLEALRCFNTFISKNAVKMLESDKEHVQKYHGSNNNWTEEEEVMHEPCWIYITEVFSL
jgi:hypothetical protein